MLRRILLTWLLDIRDFWSGQLVPTMVSLLCCPRSPKQVVYSWPDTQPLLGKRVALFVHFDRHKTIRPYVAQYVAQLHAAGLSVLFVSNAGEIKPDALETIRPYCAGILVRRNVGYDFAAMREGLAHFGLPRADTELLVLANDSVYGPLRPLDDMLAKIDFAQADFWGATESWQYKYHLQSYLLFAGPKILHHPAWAKFWNNVRSVPNKRWVISRYEVGITQWMLKADLTCAAIWPYQDLLREINEDLPIGDVTKPADLGAATSMRQVQGLRMRRRYVDRKAMNPATDLWRQLLCAGFPFLKRELLRDNPTRVADVMDWRSVVAETTGSDITLIERDLQRAARNVAP